MKKIVVCFFLLISSFSFAQWVTTSNGSHASGISITINNDGWVYLTGYYQGNVDFNGDGDPDMSAVGINDIFITFYIPGVDAVFLRSIGGKYGDYPSSIVSSNKGDEGFYLSGNFEGSANFETSPVYETILTSSHMRNPDTFVAKYTNVGDLVWAKALGSDWSQSRSMTIDENDNIYVTGIFKNSDFGSKEDIDVDNDGIPELINKGRYDIFIAKFTSEGDFEWLRGIGGERNDSVSSIKVINQSVFVTGTCVGGIDFNGDGTLDQIDEFRNGKGFLAKYSLDGDFKWVRQFQSNNYNRAYSFDIDSESNYYVTGAFLGEINFGINDSGEEVILKTDEQNYNVRFIAKFTNEGIPLWAKSIKGPINGGLDLVLDKNNNVLVEGTCEGGCDIDGDGEYEVSASDLNFYAKFIVKYSTDGNIVWTRGFDGAVDGEMILDENNNIYVTGQFNARQGSSGIDLNGNGSIDISSKPYSGSRMYLAKYNSNGIYNEPTVLEVPKDFATIQDAINFASFDDTIRVSAGTYYENLVLSNKNVNILSIEGHQKTVIDGGESGPVVSFVDNYFLNPSLIGFTIQNGFSDNGGGIYSTSSSLILKNMMIKDNEATLNGGGSYFYQSISSFNGFQVNIINSIFLDNIAKGEGFEYGGGGIYCSANDLLLNQVFVSNNTAYRGGGIMMSENAKSRLTNVTIVNNSSSDTGGGVYTTNSSIGVVNSILWNDTPNEIDGTANVNYSVIKGGWEGEGNINTNPLFCDYVSNVYPNLKGDYHLMPSSPAVGTGENGVNMGALGVGCVIDRLETLSEIVPNNYYLHENYPNPFNPTTTLRFDLPDMSDVNLTIYNMLGQRVRTFNMQSTPAGYHSIKWNATNDYGEQVGAGVYLYQLRANHYLETRKMVLLK